MESSTAADRFKPWAMAPPSVARTVALAAAIHEAAAAHPSELFSPPPWKVGDLVAVPRQVLERIGQRRPHQGIRWINEPQPPPLARPTSTIGRVIEVRATTCIVLLEVADGRGHEGTVSVEVLSDQLQSAGGAGGTLAPE